MTTVTCQRSRIVSPAGIVPIRRYIFVAFRDFFPKTAGRRTVSENDQASITRGPSAGRKTGEDGVDVATTGGPRRRLAIDFLSSSRVYDISPRFDTTRNLSACHACLSPGAAGQPARRAHRRVFVCRRGRRPDAAWISWKSGRVVQREIRPASYR